MKSKISIILLLLFIIPVYPQDDLRVLFSDLNSIVLEYKTSFSDSSEIEINKQKYLSLKLKNGSISNFYDAGMPAIPQRGFSIGVPGELGNTIQIIDAQSEDVNAMLAPNPGKENAENLYEFSYQKSEAYNNFAADGDVVTFGEYGVARGIPIQSIRILPVQFNAGNNSIKIYKKIVFQINFANSTINSTPKYDSFLDGAILNYDRAKYWKKAEQNRLEKSVVNSVLSTGKWVRFEAPEEGIYKFSRSQLSSFGIDPAAVNPRTIKIYNNSGKILPEGIYSQRPDDLEENAILISGEEDGRFDEGDYILFYGRGNKFWDVDSADNQIKKFFHKYSAKNYYWITSGGTDGKRIQQKAGLNDPNAAVQNSTKAFTDWEEDKINIGKSGREYVGDEFTSSILSRTYTFMLDGRVESLPVNYTLNFINASQQRFGLKITENGNTILSRNIDGYLSPQNYRYGEQVLTAMQFNGALPENRSIIKFEITPSSVSNVGYLNYLNIQYQKQLQAFSDFLLFYSAGSNGIFEYQLNGFTNTNIQVFDITDHANVKLITNHTLISGGECRFQINESESSISKYLAVANNFKSPVNPSEISNQNIHGISDGAEFIIISHKDFRDQADRLEAFRESQTSTPISTIVLDIDEIFNEFSCGLADPTGIRDFVKYAYDNWNIAPKHILLFGDATYDFKNVENFNNNFIPSYQTAEFLSEIFAYPMDDYFVRVDGTNFDTKADLAIGRLTIQTATDAKIVVDKIIEYENNKEYGTWRNLITLVADDGLTTDRNEFDLHTRQSENLSFSRVPNSFDLNKIYLAAYPTVITGIGRTKPGVYSDIIKAINQGTVILNYVGHGSPDLWAHEHVFETSSTIPQLVNDKYFFLTAATCDFAYFDLPSIQSGAELLMLKNKSGSIGAFSATRPVYSNNNAALNELFYQNLLKTSRDTFNLPVRIGEAYFKTKAGSPNAQQNDNKFLLLGDPTLRLDIPQYRANISSINGQSSSTNVQIKALSHATIEGEILRPNNTLWEDFNGEVVLNVFDSERSIYLSEINYSITQQGGVIFNGRVSLNNGKFTANFIVPKDISYENKNGKIVAYFFNPNYDGVGFTNNLIVGGTDSSTVNDGAGPDIEVFIDDENSMNATLANPNSNLIIKLFDETGLNTTGTGVGHKMEGILNDQENNPIDFTEYFTGDLDAGGKSGKVSYPFTNLSEGEYKIQIKAWDVFNNFSTETAYFSVVSGDNLVIRDVVNYPNPFTTNTTFTFQQNLNRIVDVKVKIYTIAGRLIKEINQNSVSDKFVKIGWDGRDEDGSQIANGTYLYKLIINTTDGEFTESVLGKLAVIK